VEFDVPKEGKEVVDFLDAILEKVMAKAELADYATLLVGALPALDGVAAIKDEIKSDGKDELAAYLVQKVMARLL
jgi:hypothetical protein